MNIWFTSDTHLNHGNIISMCDRPFKNPEEMNDTIIRNINAVVKPEDTLYFLGDMCHRTGVEKGNELISRIKCRHKVLIKGNHDKNWDPKLFEEVCDFKVIHESLKGKNFHISLMHYPMESWYKSNSVGLHFHGHSHNKPEYNRHMKEEGIRKYDVGVDANNYYPVSLEQIIKFMGLI